MDSRVNMSNNSVWNMDRPPKKKSRGGDSHGRSKNMSFLVIKAAEAAKGVDCDSNSINFLAH